MEYLIFNLRKILCYQFFFESEAEIIIGSGPHLSPSGIKTDYARVLIFCCIGFFLIGAGLVYPIYHYSSYLSAHPIVENQYSEVKPYFGTVSENASEFVVSPSAFFTVLTAEIRNFYTNNTPVTLILQQYHTNETIHNFYNQTVEPINHVFMVNSDQFAIIIRYNGSAAVFSFWLCILTQPIIPPMPPPMPLGFYIGGFLFVSGILITIFGLAKYHELNYRLRSRLLPNALIFCSIGLLLLSLSFPSILRHHYYFSYHQREYVHFGEFSDVVTDAVPHINRTLVGINVSQIEIRSLFTNGSSITVRAYTLDGVVNHTWNGINEVYPDVTGHAFGTTGDLVIEVVREVEDAEFSCWILGSYREVEIRRNYAGEYAPFAYVFLGSGVLLLGFGLHNLFRGLEDIPKKLKESQ